MLLSVTWVSSTPELIFFLRFLSLSSFSAQQPMCLPPIHHTSYQEDYSQLPSAKKLDKCGSRCLHKSLVLWSPDLLSFWRLDTLTLVLFICPHFLPVLFKCSYPGWPFLETLGWSSFGGVLNQNVQTLGSLPAPHKPDTGAHACNFSTLEEAGGSNVPGHPLL